MITDLPPTMALCETLAGTLMPDDEKCQGDMKVSILCGSSTYESRAAMVSDWFKGKNADVQLVVPDWDHLKKTRREVLPDRTAVSVKPYSKNLSLARIKSYRGFAHEAEKIVERYNPELIYTLAPPNFLAHSTLHLKESTNAVIVLDLLDLWPEALPFGPARTPVHSVWASLRNRAIAAADLLLLECRYYERVLGNRLNGVRHGVLRYARPDSGVRIPVALRDDEYRLCYLGAINNIIDIEGIARLVNNLPKPVAVEVIGDGERRELFLNAVKRSGAEVVFHGRVFDEVRKHEIMSRCHFGLNMMKAATAVGLSMKSVDYLEAGLPILNSVGGDNADLVSERGVGVNVKEGLNFRGDRLDNVASKREEARLAYEDLFSQSAFRDSLDSMLEPILESMK